MSLSALSNNRLVMPYSYVPTSQLMSLNNMFFCFLCQKPPIFLILTIYLTFTLFVAKQMLSG